eukprot:PhM_4_TR6929/c0_g1_i1/m.61664
MIRRTARRFEEVHWVTPGKTSLLPPRWKGQMGLIPKRKQDDYSYSEVSDRTWQPQAQWVDTRPAPAARAPWEQREIDYLHKEKPMIDLAFDKPEAIPLMLKDLVIKGHQGVMSPETFSHAIHWVRESRYWRCIGIYYPFYHKYRLRAHLWRWDYLPNSDYLRGPIKGAVAVTRPMVDAIMDLEKAYKRQQAGLNPEYKWDKWSPVGNNDGAINDWLPRLPTMRWDPDPDGITVERSDIEFILDAQHNSENPNQLHDEIKSRYRNFIYMDSDRYDGVFLQPSSGNVNERDFSFPTPSPDMLEMCYFVAYARTLGQDPSQMEYTEEVSGKVKALMDENAKKVEAMRMFRSCSNDIAWVREYIAEKCGLTDFMKTTDKELTLIFTKLFESMREVLAEDWGKAVAEATTLKEYHTAVGDVAFDVAMMLIRASQERVREQWSARFSSAGQEERQLDIILNKMSQRTAPSDAGNVGETFDREKEPIGRNTQRRVVSADTAQKGKFWERRQDKSKTAFDEKVLSSQF